MAGSRGKRKTNKQAQKDDKKDSNQKRPKLEHNTIKNNYEESLLQKYGMSFPDDFYQFYQYVTEIADSPLEKLNLKFTGPYDLLTGRLDKENNMSQVNYHLHGRYYFDPPEMMTVLCSQIDDGFHIGYFRDVSTELPNMMVSSCSKTKGELEICGDNIFTALHCYCKKLCKTTKDKKDLQQLKDLSVQLEQITKEYGYNLESSSSSIKLRTKNVVTKTFHRAGLMVYVDKTGVGYRELPETDRDLKKMLLKIVNAKNDAEKDTAFDELQEIITLVQFANDECDYGMGLELGIDLFIFGNKIFHGTILNLLPLAYQLIGREIYGEIVEKHIEQRIAGPIDMTDKSKKTC